jgi:hypothetical protein
MVYNDMDEDSCVNIYKHNHFHYDMQISIYVYKHLFKNLRIPNEHVNELKYKLVWRMDQS